MNGGGGEFGQSAAALFENGYDVVPIKPGTKRPPQDVWQNYQFKPTDVQQYANCGVGVLTRHTPAVDIDVSDKALAARLKAYAEEFLGVAPERVGQSPRCALIYQSAEEFLKMQSRPFRLPGDALGAKPHKVEILAKGQQIVLYAVHPETNKPYRWMNGSEPKNTPHSDLTPVTRAQMVEFLDGVNDRVAKIKGVVFLSEASQALEDGQRNSSEMKAKDAGRCRDALRAIKNLDLDYDAWMRLMLATKGALGEEGLEDFLTWSAKSAKHDERFARKEFERCKPDRIGAGSIYFLAKQDGWVTPEEKAAQWPRPLDLLRLSKTEPQPPQFIVPAWLPCGYATMFAGHGGVGKSGIALHLGTCIARGQPFFGLPVQQRRVLYLCCEDRENILHWRLSRIAQHEKISIADLNGNLLLLDLVGRPSVLWERDPLTRNALTAAYGQLVAMMKEFAPEVVIVDGVADTFGGNENARSEVKAYVNALLGLIDPERGAVLLIAHINRTTALNVETSEGYSGSTQWHNAVRARWYLYPEMEEGEENKGPKLPTGNLFLKVQKSNLGKKADAMTFAWDEEAKMFLAQEVVAMAPDDLEHRERDEAEWLLRAIVKAQDAGVPVLSATSGRRTSFHVLSAMPGFPEALRRSKTRFWRHLEVLRNRRHIEEDTIRKNRNKTGVLVATEAGREVASGEVI